MKEHLTLMLNLKKQIFGEFIKQLFTDWINQESTITENISQYNIYLPIDFTLWYNCNDNDKSIIYNSIKNTTVKFTNTLYDKIGAIVGPDHINCILADTSEEKVGVYNFSITYLDNDYLSDIIDNIEIICEYILPYVNDNGYWVINNETTDIFALGTDAGNPNIILAYSNALTYQIVAGVEKDILQSWNWVPTPITMEPLDRDNNIAEAFHYELNAYMPSSETINSLPNDQFALISNALIVNFLSPDCETYPEIYTTTSYLDESKIIYSDFTYDPVTAKRASFTYYSRNLDLTNRDMIRTA